MENKKARRGGKKNRKHGRNGRKPGSSRQKYRTAHNKAHTMLYEEYKAGRQLSWPNASEDAMSILVGLRGEAKRAN